MKLKVIWFFCAVSVRAEVLKAMKALSEVPWQRGLGSKDPKQVYQIVLAEGTGQVKANVQRNAALSAPWHVIYRQTDTNRPILTPVDFAGPIFVGEC